MFHSDVERALEATRPDTPCIDLSPTPFHRVPRVLCEQDRTDVLLMTVSPIDDTGYFSFGTNTDYALAVARSGARVIVEVNRNMPRVAGNCLVHVSQVAAVVENDMPLL